MEGMPKLYLVIIMLNVVQKKSICCPKNEEPQKGIDCTNVLGLGAVMTMCKDATTS